MAGDEAGASPDFRAGVDGRALADGGMLQGKVGDDDVLVVRRGHELFAVGASCTHYGGPLAEGLVVGDTIRCPWHHASFSLRSGEMDNPPALDPLKCWAVEERDGKIFVGRERTLKAAAPAEGPESIVVVGGGAAATSAVLALRRQGYEGPITILSADHDAPVDRPNLSKDYLAGNADPAWLPLRPEEFWAEHKIDLRLQTEVTAIDAKAKRVTLADGGTLSYGALLLATGGEPNRLPVPGADGDNVLYLRSMADAEALVARAGTAKRAVVVGAGFIGLEAAASLRKRGLAVDVVAPDSIPMERILGPDLGRMLQAAHEEQGVRFHLRQQVKAIDADGVTLASGERLAADFVLVGIGVHPRIALAEAAGLAVDRGVLVNEYLESSAAGVFAAGDIAAWPDPNTGARIRVEHWAVAERQGMVAAHNMLGRRERYRTLPFFWSQHFDTTVNYVGHGAGFDRVELSGDATKRDVKARYWKGGKLLAVATVGRDLDSLKEAAAMEEKVPA